MQTSELYETFLCSASVSTGEIQELRNSSAPGSGKQET